MRRCNDRKIDGNDTRYWLAGPRAKGERFCAEVNIIVYRPSPLPSPRIGRLQARDSTTQLHAVTIAYLLRYAKREVIRDDDAVRKEA